MAAATVRWVNGRAALRWPRPGAGIRAARAARRKAGEQIAVHRIAQEALTNVRKHAGAQSVTASVRVDPDLVELHVIDDGVGMGNGGGTAARRGHIGLMEMRQRAVDAGGALTITPNRPSGTDVGFRWQR